MRLLGGAVAAALLLTACGGGGDSVVEGRIIAFDGDLEVVRSFTLVTEDGESLEFVPAPGAAFHGGPLSHLRDHLVSGERVVVFYVEENGDLVVSSVEDR